MFNHREVTPMKSYDRQILASMTAELRIVATVLESDQPTPGQLEAAAKTLRELIVDGDYLLANNQ